MGLLNMKKGTSKKCNFKKINKLQINKWLRMFILFIFAAILIVMVFFIYKAQKQEKYIDRQVPIFSYNNIAKVNYEVFLLPNDIYSVKSLKEGNTYMANLIDYIDTDFRYEFRGDGPAKVQGKYNVHAVLEGYIQDEKSSKTLWKKDYELLPDTSIGGDNKVVSVQKKMPIDTEKYMEFINSTNKTMGFNCSIKLTFIWNVAVDINTPKGTKNENLSCTMEIPYGQKYFEIKGNLSDNKKGTIDEIKKEISPTYQRNMVLYKMVLGFSVVLLILLLVFTASKEELKPIDKKRNQIFKDHGDRLVAVYNEINDGAKAIIEVLSIDDLIKIADDIGRPVLYKGSIDAKEIYNFYVLDENNAYMLDIQRDLLSEE